MFIPFHSLPSGSEVKLIAILFGHLEVSLFAELFTVSTDEHSALRRDELMWIRKLCRSLLLDCSCAEG
jgi:hypothetical protein